MSSIVNITLSAKDASRDDLILCSAARELRIEQARVAFLRIIKRSIDARHNPIKVNLTIEVFIDTEEKPSPITFDYPSVVGKPEVAIVGAGPAGLYAALRLIEHGLKPVVFERGKDVVERGKDIALIQRNAAFDSDSNYAFGEGGAGTFSDGKLFTRSKKRGDYNRSLQRLVYHGASPEILYEAHPHIGSDRLPRIIASMRRQILDCGGEIHFSSRVTGIALKNGRVRSIVVNGNNVDVRALILSTGHSARDIYYMLHDAGVRLEPKPFAMGVRIEHPQQLINQIQYHRSPDMEFLPPAAYQLVTQVGGRGVYSFCMCPGGFIVPALTSEDESVVNGMSPSHRGSPYANSGFVTEIRCEDFARYNEKYGVLAGLEFQRQLEHMARANAGRNHSAPAQRVGDFVRGCTSATLPKCSFVPGIVPSRLDQWLPEFMSARLREAISVFDRKMRGYMTNEAIVVGVESRTSTPVRIPRDAETLQHSEVVGLFPTGEGAGYAGGIISAALDGERVADAIMEAYASGRL